MTTDDVCAACDDLLGSVSELQNLFDEGYEKGCFTSPDGDVIHTMCVVDQCFKGGLRMEQDLSDVFYHCSKIGKIAIADMIVMDDGFAAERLHLMKGDPIYSGYKMMLLHQRET